MSEHFADVKAAREYITGHDTEAARLTKMTSANLHVEWLRELSSRHITSVSGGPARKDEYIRSLLEYRYPLMREAYELRAGHDAREARESGINELAMRLGVLQDDVLAEVLQRAHPAARQRLHAMTSVYAPTVARYLDWPLDYSSKHPGHTEIVCKAMAPAWGVGSPVVCGAGIGEASSARQLLELIREHDQRVVHCDPPYEAQ